MSHEKDRFMGPIKFMLFCQPDMKYLSAKLCEFVLKTFRFPWVVFIGVIRFLLNLLIRDSFTYRSYFI
jgi:hypothetical protein